MWRKFSWYDVRIIAHYSGALVLFMAAALLLPLLTSLAMQEWAAVFRYAFGLLTALFVGFGLRLFHVAPGKLTQVQAIAVTGLAWFILALVGSIPLALSDHFATYLDALFDTLSAWTTTGASLAFDVDHMAYADHMWRFLMEFIGGQGVVVIALSVGIMGKTSSTSLYDSEGRSEHVLPGIMQTTRFIVRMALGVVAVGAVILAIVCMLIGMNPVDAFFNGLWLAMASFDTGGLTPTSIGLVYYHSFLLEMVIVILMLMGTINFALHSEIWHGRLEQFFKDIEIRASFVWVSVAVLVLTAALAAGGAFNDAATLVRRGVFTVIAAFTTTGFQTISANQLTTLVSSGAILVIIFLMLIGGSAGSTSGGIKIMRLAVLGKEAYAYIKEQMAPSSARQVVTYYHVGRHPLNVSLVRANLTVFVLFVAAFALTGIVTVAYGYDAMSALFESAAMVSNSGMTTGIIGPDMPLLLKVLYMFDMWAGRLEWVSLIALLISAIMSIKPRKRVRS